MPAPHGLVGQGSEEYANVAVPPVTIEGLTPLTAYGFRAFAKNAHGESESVEITFRTEPIPSGSVLPDGRHWEIVSPLNTEKNGAYIEASSNEGGDIQASSDGNAITYIASNAIKGAEGNRSPEPNQLLSVRTAEPASETSSWSTNDVNTPNKFAEGIVTGSPMAYRIFSSDLSVALVDPYIGDEPVLSPKEIEKTTFLRHDFSCPAPPETCYEPLLDAEYAEHEFEVTTETGKEKLVAKFSSAKPAGADESLSAIILQTNGPVTAERANLKGANLYEWKAGQKVKLVNALSNGTPLTSPELGAEARVLKDTVSEGPSPSEDGLRVIFSATLGFGRHLFERNLETGKTVQVDTPESGTPTGRPEYQAASKDGKTIFFTDPARLTANATSTETKPDLYVCEVQEPAEGEPSCKLKDLTTSTNPGEAADVQGAVQGASADGSEVFFVADGQLASNATKGDCVPGRATEERGAEVELGGVCELYVAKRSGESWEAPKPVAALSQEDEPDWASDWLHHDLGSLTARVSPSGEWITFMSDRRLPTTTNPAGYNNHDIVSGKSDEEVFLYDAKTEALVCASCDPTGSRPRGVHDLQESGEGLGLLVDRPQNWGTRTGGAWLAANVPGYTKIEEFGAWYQPRYLLDNGRLYFNSPQALVPEAKNGKMDVYQWEPPGIGACTTSSDTYSSSSLGCVSLISSGDSSKESAFLDASENGNDVFFDTAIPLFPTDTDQDYDVYDASVCNAEGTAPCVKEPAPQPQQCVGECRVGGPVNNASGSSSPGTLSSAASSNVSRHEVLGKKEEKKPTTKKKLTRAQLYAKAVKACKKIKNKHKRATCLAKAKKQYGPKKAKKSSQKAKGKR